MLGGVDGDRIPPGLEVPVTASFSGLALTTQQPVIVRSQEEALRFPTAASLVQALGVESFCMLPLTTTVRPLGAMGFGTARRHAIDDSDLEFLDLVVKQVAVAVDNVSARRKRSGRPGRAEPRARSVASPAAGLGIDCGSPQPDTICFGIWPSGFLRWSRSITSICCCTIPRAM